MCPCPSPETRSVSLHPSFQFGLALLLLFNMLGCQRGEPTIDSSAGTDIESAIHDLRSVELENWACRDETWNVVLFGEDRAGWTVEWSVGGGRILDQGSSRLIWRTPQDTVSWVQAILVRGAERHTCRRWLVLHDVPLAVSLHGSGEETLPGVVHVTMEANRPQDAPAVWSYGCDEGELSVVDGGQVDWDVHRAGLHRMWVELRLEDRLARDTLMVEVPNLPPQLSPDCGYPGDWELGDTKDVWVLGLDANQDPLTLSFQIGPGLLLLDSARFNPEPLADVLVGWRLTLKDTLEEVGRRWVAVNLSDGTIQVVDTVNLWVDDFADW
jgi:hypothetical protein